MKYTISILLGISIGCVAMFICNKDSIRHYNVCQEKELLKTIAESGDEKQWYIKEDALGKIKLIQLSKHELDSLSK